MSNEDGMSRRAFLASGAGAVLGGAALLGATTLLGSTICADEAHASGLLGNMMGTLKKATVEDYSWDELSAIADEISTSGSAEAAIEVAKGYNLCTPDGKLDGTQAKSFTMADGTPVQAQIAGFYHDDKSDGTGKAGITFIFSGGVYLLRQIEFGPGYDYGMRAWLASDFADMLPTDLVKNTVIVDKLSNYIFDYVDRRPVTTLTLAQDPIWRFSVTELSGSQFDGLELEGTEYQLFSDCGVTMGDGAVNPILIKNYLAASYLSDYANQIQGAPCNWAVRTPQPTYSVDVTQGVDTNGCPNCDLLFPVLVAIVPGFCL